MPVSYCLDVDKPTDQVISHAIFFNYKSYYEIENQSNYREQDSLRVMADQ
uniref:Uncharacterized protein n=1 Tax=Anguilla anguilla TaxID=7936 RepID=A0A0E9RUC7_ANGAN